jgi:hypothetical protein
LSEGKDCHCHQNFPLRNKKERKRENNSLVQGNIFPTAQRFGLDTATFSMVERAFQFGPLIAIASMFVQQVVVWKDENFLG